MQNMVQLPKGRNAADLAYNPNGGTARKYCYWFNSEYVTGIIEKLEEKKEQDI